MAPIAPTSLPPLRKLAECSVADVIRSLRGISQLYWPTPPPAPLPSSLLVPNTLKRTSRPKRYGDFKIPDSGYASTVVSDDEGASALDDVDSDSSSDSLDPLRADSFEREFAVKWITGLIGRIDQLSFDDPDIDPDEAQERLLEEASTLLARFSQHEDADEEFDIVRSFSFPSVEETVHIQLNDAPLSNSDHTSVGLQSWGSAIVLAERLCADPASFGLLDGELPLRVLELGAGTGLLSIAVAKLLPRATVVATDYHPAILANLAANLRTNFRHSSDDRVCAVELDWERPTDAAPLDVPFDVVLAADVVYHPAHARWLRGCAARMLRLPDSAVGPGGVFHLIVPVRTSGRHDGMDRTVDEVFGDVSGDAEDRPGYRLVILDKRGVGRQGGGVGRADEEGYRLFRIGWVSCTP